MSTPTDNTQTDTATEAAGATPGAAGAAGLTPLLPLLAAALRTGRARLHNARGGFACNSSSSHSIVIVDAGEHQPTHRTDPDAYTDWFRLTDSVSKVHYLLSNLASEGAHLGPDGERTLAHAMAATSEVLSPDEHDSVWRRPPSRLTDTAFTGLPTSSRTGEAELEFLTDLLALLAQDGTQVHGSDDSTPPAAPDGSPLLPERVTTLPKLTSRWRARKDIDPTDPTGTRSWWVLWDPTDGTKLRLSLDVEHLRADTAAQRATRRVDLAWATPSGATEPVQPLGHMVAYDEPMAGSFTPTKAAAPELVDVKLTDACPFERDCSFCYMGSTVDGAAGDAATVGNLLTALADLGVLEVAFGGGEPTTWPHLTQTLQLARSLGITPNFTTKNFAWLTRPHATAWLDLVGSVAFSVNTIPALEQLTRALDKLAPTLRHPSLISRKVTIQLIPDLVPAGDFTQILNTALTRRLRVTLLGYKDVGRGAQVTPAYRRSPSWWIEQVAAAHQAHPDRIPSVAIDTALALTSRDELTARGIPSWMYHVEEGAFSAYIDAVTARMGPSSYAGDGSLEPLNLTDDPAALAEQIRALFLTYDPAGSVAP